MDVTGALALARLVRDSAALLLWGSSVYRAALAPSLLRRGLADRSARWVRLAVLTLVAALATQLPVLAASVGDGWAAAFDPGMLAALLSETSLGTAWLVQAAAATALLPVLMLPDPWRDRATAAFSAIILGGLALTGHPAMHEAWIGAAQRLDTVLHVLAAGFWLGALLPLLATLRLLGNPSRSADAVVALRRFSTAGHVAVTLVLVTGLVNAALIFERWPTDWSSPYRGLLIAKIVVVAAMAAFAILNRYRFVPAMRDTPREAKRRIRQATLAEIALGSGAVALVAIFGQLDPA